MSHAACAICTHLVLCQVELKRQQWHRVKHAGRQLQSRVQRLPWAARAEVVLLVIEQDMETSNGRLMEPVVSMEAAKRDGCFEQRNVELFAVFVILGNPL